MPKIHRNRHGRPSKSSRITNQCEIPNHQFPFIKWADLTGNTCFIEPMRIKIPQEIVNICFDLSTPIAYECQYNEEPFKQKFECFEELLGVDITWENVLDQAKKLGKGTQDRWEFEKKRAKERGQKTLAEYREADIVITRCKEHLRDLNSSLNNIFNNDTENDFLIPFNNNQYDVNNYKNLLNLVENIIKICKNLSQYLKDRIKFAKTFIHPIRNFKELHDYIFDDSSPYKYQNDFEFIRGIQYGLNIVIRSGNKPQHQLSQKKKMLKKLLDQYFNPYPGNKYQFYFSYDDEYLIRLKNLGHYLTIPIGTCLENGYSVVLTIYLCQIGSLIIVHFLKKRQKLLIVN